jgi:uncharacterized protein (DUF58 family)
MDHEKRDLDSLNRLYQWARRSSWKPLGQKTRGRGLEFASYRNYVPGDDLRRIDWVVYARLSRLVVKLVEELPEPHVELILDSSPSMATGHPPIFPTAALLAASFGAIFMARGSAVKIQDGGALSRGEQFRGQGRLLGLLRSLRAYKCDGSLDLNKAAATLLGQEHKNLVIVTDGLMPGRGFVTALKRLQQDGHTVFVVIVQAPRECPEEWLQGHSRGAIWELEAAESGALAKRHIDHGVLSAMSQKRRCLIEELELLLRAAHLAWTVMSSDQNTEKAVKRLFGPLAESH